MKSNLMFDFSVDKENKKIVVEKEYAAPISAVWATWTKAELLDQWWAPEPWRAETSTMEFKEGGQWLYAMMGPKGEKIYSRVDYGPITIEKSFSALDSFCDEKGKVNSDLPRSEWKVEFSENSGTTRLKVDIQHESPEDLEKILKMGFREGFTETLGKLEALLH